MSLTGSAEQLQTNRSRQAEYMAKRRKAEQDIGDLPYVEDEARKKRCSDKLECFATEYFPHVFYNTITEDHKDDFKTLQYAIENGGLFAKGAPRGDGKTSRVEVAAIWGLFTGRIRYGVAIGADKNASDEIKKFIMTEVETNDFLLADFPEICYPVRCLEGATLRTKTQTYHGALTRMEWKADRLVFPTMEDSKASGAIFEGCGITGRVRGRKIGTLRPDFVLMDDPQTRESAKSPQQCKDRTKIIKGDVLGLAGPGKDIAAVILCTIIEEDDLAAQMLDNEKSPEWLGKCSKFFDAFPDDMDFWTEDYHDVWIKSLKQKNKNKLVNAFYKKNRERLEAGAAVSNPYRFEKPDISAIQHGMHLYFKCGKAEFYSEYQNDPISATSCLYNITAPMVASRCNGLNRMEVPTEANFLVAYADINYIGLNHVSAAFSNHFTGSIVDYGKYPEGKKALYDPDKANTKTAAQAIAKGINDLILMFDSKKAYVQDDKRIPLDLLLIDGNFMTETVFNSVRTSVRKIKPMFKVVVHRGRPHKRYRPIKTTLVGRPYDSCHIEIYEKGSIKAHQSVSSSCFWRMTTQKAFLLSPEQPGSLSFWGDEKKYKRHLPIAAQIVGEKLANYADTSEGPMFEWNRTPGVLNDQLDALVGCCVAANVLGAELTGGEESWRKKKKEAKASPKENRKPTNQPRRKTRRRY